MAVLTNMEAVLRGFMVEVLGQRGVDLVVKQEAEERGKVQEKEAKQWALPQLSAVERRGAGGGLAARRAPLHPPQWGDPREVLVGVLGPRTRLPWPPSHHSHQPRPSLPPHPAHLAPKRPRLEPPRQATLQASYRPRLEALSPSPEERRPARGDARSTKDKLLQDIARVDKEIAMAEAQIGNLRKTQEELEAAESLVEERQEQAQAAQAVQDVQDMQAIYQENRRKAGLSHAALQRFAPNLQVPLSSSEVCRTNKEKNLVFKKKLVEHLRRKEVAREEREQGLAATYSRLAGRWRREVGREEGRRSLREREARERQQYEEVFPDLGKARGGGRSASRGEGRGEGRAEVEERRGQSYATIPALLPPKERGRRYTSTNGLMADPLLVYKERRHANIWTDAEKEMFSETFLQAPKNFGAIAACLASKTAGECVEYYFRSKKTTNYKQLARRAREG